MATEILYSLRFKQLINAIDIQYCFPKVGNFEKKSLHQINKIQVSPNM